MDDRKIEVLLTTIRAGSFSKAANELNCTQSAVTQTMNGLESELGFKVLKRGHNGVVLTPAGEEIYVSLVEVYESMMRMKKNAERIASGRNIPIRIGVFSSISNSFLGRMIYEYQQTNPKTGIQLNIGTKEIKTWLRNGEIDIAIADMDICKTFNWHKLFDDTYHAVVPTNFEIAGKEVVTSEDLMKYPIIKASFNDYNTMLKNADHMIDIACDDDRTVLSFVSSELGVTALPSLSLWDVPDNVKILDLEPKVSRQIGYALAPVPRRDVLAFAKFMEKRIKDYKLAD